MRCSARGYAQNVREGECRGAVRGGGSAARGHGFQTENSGRCDLFTRRGARTSRKDQARRHSAGEQRTGALRCAGTILSKRHLATRSAKAIEGSGCAEREGG